jgi:hypothetical protein
MTMGEAFWPLGLAAQHDPVLAAATVAVLEQSVPADTFRSAGSAGAMEMWIDTGHGFERPLRKDVNVNRNGLSYAHYSAEGRGIRAIRFDPCDFPAIVRLDRIEIYLKVVGSAELVPVHLSDATDFARLEYRHCRWLYNGVVYSAGSHPQIHIAVADRAPAEIYAVELHVAFSVTRLPPALVDIDVGGYQTKFRRAVARGRAAYQAGGLGGVARGARRVVARRLTSRRLQRLDP